MYKSVICHWPVCQGNPCNTYVIHTNLAKELNASNIKTESLLAFAVAKEIPCKHFIFYGITISPISSEWPSMSHPTRCLPMAWPSYLLPVFCRPTESCLPRKAWIMCQSKLCESKHSAAFPSSSSCSSSSPSSTTNWTTSCATSTAVVVHVVVIYFQIVHAVCKVQM